MSRLGPEVGVLHTACGQPSTRSLRWRGQLVTIARTATSPVRDVLLGAVGDRHKTGGTRLTGRPSRAGGPECGLARGERGARLPAATGVRVVADVGAVVGLHGYTASASTSVSTTATATAEGAKSVQLRGGAGLSVGALSGVVAVTWLPATKATTVGGTRVRGSTVGPNATGTAPGSTGA